MSRDVVASGREEPERNGAGLRVAVVCGRFNDHVTVRLLEGVRRGLRDCKVADDDVTEAWVPGSFELPLTAKTFAMSGAVDAVICIGSVIRGDTAHFDLVAGECARGIQQVGLETGVPDRVRRPHHRRPRPGAVPVRTGRRPQRRRGGRPNRRRDGPPPHLHLEIAYVTALWGPKCTPKRGHDVPWRVGD